MFVVVSRWHGVESKNFDVARWRKLLVVQGAAADIAITMSPRLVFSVAVNGFL